jgi:hypothetical protein
LNFLQLWKNSKTCNKENTFDKSWRGVLDTTICDKVCQWLVAGRWFPPGIPVSSTNKTDRHDIIEIFLNVALNTIALTIHLIKINGNTLLIFCKNIFDTTSNFCVFVFVHFRALKEYGGNLVWWHYVSVLGGDVKRHLHVVVFLFFFNFHSPIWALTACFDIYVCIIT